MFRQPLSSISILRESCGQRTFTDRGYRARCRSSKYRFRKSAAPICKIGLMVTIALAVIAYVRAFFAPRHRLALEAAALRQQLVVFEPPAGPYKLRRLDRLFWIALRQLWAGWAEALIIVKPETVVSWHRAGFRLFWRLRSRSRRPGRPKVSEEIRHLIRRMKQDNPTWGAASDSR